MNNQLSAAIKRLIVSKELKINMTEASRLTGVSTSQLRYWEKKGYIKSEQGEQNKNHYFTLTTVLQAFTIKFFLDQGFTLAMAVKKEQKRRESSLILRQFITNGVTAVKQNGEVKLGPLADDPATEVYAQVAGDHVSYHLRPVKPSN